MRHEPPIALLELLARLEIAHPAQVRGVGRRVKRLSRGLPNFESVWVDALVQARLLTPFQAAEIHACRGDALRVGPYVLRERVASLGYATVYHAREPGTVRDVRLAVIKVEGILATPLAAEARTLVERWLPVETPTLARVEQAGQHQYLVWLVSRQVEGRPVAEWLSHNGRLSPLVALEVARQMAQALAACEARGLLHGDLGARQLWIEPDGRVVLTEPGVRPLVRPVEDAARTEGPLAMYDYLAPERVTEGARPTVASDLYACGALWWHLLAGRPPLAGSCGATKTRFAEAARITDIAELAPDTPAALLQVVRACLQCDPAKRPASFAEVAAALGAPTSEGQRTLAAMLRGGGRSWIRQGGAPRQRRWPARVARWASAAAAMAVVLAVMTWPRWGPRWVAVLRNEITAPTPPPPRLLSPPPTATPIELASANVPLTEVSTVPNYRPGSATVDPESITVLADGAVAARDIPLAAGHKISGSAVGRTTIQVPRDGWRIDVEDVEFENVDFVWESLAEPRQELAENVMLDVRVHRVSFAGCSWTARAPDGRRPCAIAWRGPDRQSSHRTTRVGELSLHDCLLTNVATGVRRADGGSMAIELSNVLHLGPGPLVQLDRVPRLEESIALRSEHVTLRDAAGLIWCQLDRVQEPGRIAIQTNDCAFVPAADWALLVFAGRDNPAPVVREVQWLGQGSVVSQPTPLVGWLGPDGQLHAADETGVRVEGLVRNDVGFAGERTAGPAASRIVRWQAPLRSAEPPGISGETPPPGPGPR